MTGGATAGQPSILLVDDDSSFRLALARSLRSRGYDVRVAADYDQAVASARFSSPKYAVVDVRMPGRSGLELIETITRDHPAVVVVVLTGDRSARVVADASHCGAKGYLTKPADTDDIIAALMEADAR